MRLFRQRKKNSRPIPHAERPLQEKYPDLSQATIRTIEKVQPYTMTSPERIAALCDSIRYLQLARIPGAIVECGVWRGGSMLAAIQTLAECGENQRDLWLYDTFDGMTEPGPVDVDFLGRPAGRLLQEQDRDDPNSIWCYSQLDQVRQLLGETGYPGNRIHFVAGPVEETIPDSMPDQISLLRLDTDWYESTRHELTHLLPRMVRGAVLIVDDYGHWEGCRRAVDEFFAEHNVSILLNRIDYTGRIGVLAMPLPESLGKKSESRGADERT